MRSSCARSAAPALNVPSADRIAVEAGEDFSVRVRFERDMAAEPGGNSALAQPVALALFADARKPEMTLRYGGELD